MAREAQGGIYGPYPHRRRWRIVVVGPAGGRAAHTFATRGEAEGFKAHYQARLEGVTVIQALGRFVEYRKTCGIAASTIKTERHRIEALVTVHRLAELTPAKATALWSEFRKDTPTDTQIGVLSAVQRFAAWCVVERHLRKNPFAGLKHSGRRKRGKPRLTTDESRTLSAYALSVLPERRAWAALLPLWLGLRAGEVAGLEERDLDDRGRVLRIQRASTKTDAGERPVAVPEFMREPLRLALRAGKLGSRHWVNYHAKALCEEAGVPVRCPQGLRCTSLTLSVKGAAIADGVARALEDTADGAGHASSAVTRRHYVGADVLGELESTERFAVLSGGRN